MKITHVLAIVIGLAAILGGAYYVTVAPVTCHQKVIHPGETCKSYRNGTQSYERVRSVQHSMGWILIAIGSGVTIGAIVRAIKGTTHRPAAPRSYAPPTRPGPYSPPGGSYPPHGAPPQYPPLPRGQPYYPPPQYPPPGYPPPGPPLPPR